MGATGASLKDVVTRLRAINDALPSDDGAAVFNRMYLTVTEQVAAALTGAQVFRNPAFMEHLDATFAALWFETYDAPGDAVPNAWAPLFEHRHNRSLLPIQFALAGMNSHIGHDLPVAVVRTCRELSASPDDAGVREDYEAVNDLLAACESEVRRSFLNDVGQVVNEQVGPVVHLISSWNIDKAREVAWVNAEALWTMRSIGFLADRYEAALAGTVGMASRYLLTPALAS
ncbi:MAG: hypothetical protein HHJ11_01375 [Phycicoccus sp.]|nr:hypothetical protein [Phycicoccus sp.]NMM32473.1 hypothetical protein [Phycicoccus sp.]